MNGKITYYLEVISSWCHWAEPAWAELKRRYAGRVEFAWKIAQMPAAAYPVSRSQCEWFYRRSGSIMRSTYMLNPGWFEPEIKEYLVPNLVAEAARDLGATDDRVRLAISRAAVRDGQSEVGARRHCRSLIHWSRVSKSLRAIAACGLISSARWRLRLPASVSPPPIRIAPRL